MLAWNGAKIRAVWDVSLPRRNHGPADCSIGLPACPGRQVYVARACLLATIERAEDNRYSRARVAETEKDASRHATPDAPERLDHRRRCTRHDHRTVLLRI